MAAFFKTAAPPGPVVRAGSLFIRRPGAVFCAWRRAPNGQLACVWRAPSAPADASAEPPLRLALAS